LVRLSDLSRKFKNLEALQKEVAASDKSGFDASRVTITQSDGTELNRVVWSDRSQEKNITQIVNRIFDMIDSEYEHLKPILVAKLAERVFGENLIPQTIQLQSKRQIRKDQQHG
jgi:hypothetical protein